MGEELWAVGPDRVPCVDLFFGALITELAAPQVVQDEFVIWQFKTGKTKVLHLPSAINVNLGISFTFF